MGPADSAASAARIARTHRFARHSRGYRGPIATRTDRERIAAIDREVASLLADVDAGTVSLADALETARLYDQMRDAMSRR